MPHCSAGLLRGCASILWSSACAVTEGSILAAAAGRSLAFSAAINTGGDLPRPLCDRSHISQQCTLLQMFLSDNLVRETLAFQAGN